MEINGPRSSPRSLMSLEPDVRMASKEVLDPLIDGLVQAFAEAIVAGAEMMVGRAIDQIARHMEAGGAVDGFGLGGGLKYPASVGGDGFEGGRRDAASQVDPVTSAPTGPTRSGAGNDRLDGFRSSRYDHLITQMAAKYGVPARLIKSVIEQESKFIPTAGSGKGARGLMQLMPATARELGVRNVLDPRQNIEGGTKYLARMLKMFKGNIPHALAAYNAGPGNVLKYHGIPPFKETRGYVRLITANYYAG